MMAKKKRANHRKPKPPVVAGQPLTQTPPAPKQLGEHGRKYWQRITPLLVDLGVLTDLHLEALESLCDWWDVYQANKLLIAADPAAAVVECESGYRQKSPEATQMDTAFKNLTTLWSRFGLTPHAEKRLTPRTAPSKTPAGPTADPVADFAARKYGEPD